jgi:hypothetical protein
MISRKGNNTIDDAELEAILGAATARLDAALGRHVNPEAGLRTVVSTARRSRRPTATDTALEPRDAEEGQLDTPRSPRKLNKVSYAMLGISALVVATTFAAIAELAGGGSGGGTGPVAQAAATSIAKPSAAERAPQIPLTGVHLEYRPVTLDGHTYEQGFSTQVGCTETVITTAVDRQRFESLRFTVGEIAQSTIGSSGPGVRDTIVKVVVRTASRDREGTITETLKAEARVGTHTGASIVTVPLDESATTVTISAVIVANDGKVPPKNKVCSPITLGFGDLSFFVAQK